MASIIYKVMRLTLATRIIGSFHIDQNITILGTTLKKESEDILYRVYGRFKIEFSNILLVSIAAVHFLLPTLLLN